MKRYSYLYQTLFDFYWQNLSFRWPYDSLIKKKVKKMKVEINIKNSDWKKLEKIAKRLRRKTGYKAITAKRITQYLINDYLK